MPTGKRMDKLRSEGLIHMSRDVVNVVSMLTGYYVLVFCWNWVFSDMKYVLVKSYALIGSNEELSISSLNNGFLALLIKIGPAILVITGTIAFFSTLAVMLQTHWNVKKKWIEFKFSMLHPISGLRKIFSVGGFVATLKALVKLCLILPIGYFGLIKFAPDMVGLIHTSVEALLEYTGLVMGELFWKMMYVLIILAIIDWFWGKYQWLRQNKMTKEEVKDERKAQEGDETTKKKIQMKGFQRIWMRIKKSVPRADVVITNPTHYAVALKYERNKMGAPVILAKGKGFLALRIREIAREHGIPVLERKPLARALYDTGEIGKEIPYELYRAVAEVIAYIYRLRNPQAQLGTATT